MQFQPTEYIQRSKLTRQGKRAVWSIVAACSFIVVMAVFWYLKLIGITMAGEAFCGMQEHVHSEECMIQTLVCTLPEDENHTHTGECFITEKECPIEEHIHTESCYSDLNADLETADDWEMSFAEAGRGGSTAENTVILARSQIGYTESTRNFVIGDDGIRRGITRYGQWYGNPYGDWSAMFALFCLDYAGATDIPYNAGAEALRIDWEDAGIYKPADEFSPRAGDILFLSKNEAAPGTADKAAVITSVTEDTIYVIEGDVEGCVAELSYPFSSKEILGYGAIPDTGEFAVYISEPGELDTLAAAVNFESSMLTSSDRFVIYTVVNGTVYIIDGAGNAVMGHIDANGRICADTDDPDMLYWSFSRYNNNSTAIQNAGSGRYLHPFYNSSSDCGITTPGRWGTSVSASGRGMKLSHSAYIGFDPALENFFMTRDQNQNVTFMVARSTPCTVWFDGTCGGIMSLGGSDDRAYTVYSNSTMTLPESWKSPVKYEYELKGWYDITNNKYYAPGDKVTVTGNMVFYADWKAASYDIGEFNSQVADTVSTDSFVTTRLFDYGALMNLLSEKVDVTVSASSHSEKWNLITNGNNPYNGDPTFNFIFRDWDRGNEDISYPNGHNDINNPTEAGTVYPGLYTDAIRDALFDPEVILPGKTYLGEADHLFQLCLDPDHEHFGYYYYNSERNAASYNQSDQRFYIYDYLEATRDSINNEDAGKYSDFLPLNSPYANSNGKSPVTYNYEGTEGEYTQTAHYMYDSRYNDNNNSTANIGTNFWFGMVVDIDFYLPLSPGGRTASGEYGNKDIYGEDMHFRFTGDDDVWVFVDGKLVLDLGGLHGRETGDINFSTGTVTINGVKNDELSRVLQSVQAGEHTLTLYYLERGSSMSNCAIYFNLAPRFSFSIQKEDVLTREVLNGAQFSVYTDRECTKPAELWTSKESHDKKDPATNVFTVTDGVANMWGMGAGNVYYIRETKPPDNPDYGFSNGLIKITLDKEGTASYEVEILDEGSGISPGFNVHGFRIDTQTQRAYIVATNAPKWVKDTTCVEVIKHWDDTKDHSGEDITVYLTVTDSEGRVTRLREAVLNEENGWMAKWENLPKYAENGITPIRYGVEESYAPGYYSSIEKANGQFEVVRTQWRSADTFENGKVYILKNSKGQALSTLQYAEDTGFKWVDAESAKTSSLALWRASVNGSNVRLTNLEGQTITFYYGNGSPTDFFALNRHLEDNNRKQYLNFSKHSGGLILKYNNYYLASALNGSQKFENNTQVSNALVLMPETEQTTSVNIPIEGEGFVVTNTPLEKETSVTVKKNWSIPHDMDTSVYEKEQITVRLYANGVDTGRTVTLSLKNAWTASFKGLPYEDSEGNAIVYSLQEVINGDKWIVSYGEMTASGASPPVYSSTITNTYRTGGPMLPATGTPSRILYILCGSAIMLCPVIYMLSFRRKRERRRE
ncbi:MAG: Cna B-type domain-containing protein [Ruminococcaceae bacterium]|nr:Cna B-type domain-containing protein [Oscillospiraceae bacterium]